MEAVIGQLKRLPFLSILFLLLVTVLALYNMNHIMAWLSSLGYNTFLFLSYVLAGLGAIVVVYLVFFLFFKYRLNQRHMKYQYYTNISERHGLIILDDRTVLHKNGSLLVQGRRWRKPKQVATVEPGRVAGGIAAPGTPGRQPPAGAQVLMPEVAAPGPGGAAGPVAGFCCWPHFPRKCGLFYALAGPGAGGGCPGRPGNSPPGQGWGLLALSGMGAGAAREAAARLVAQFRPHFLISLGFGGALSPELPPGDLVLGESFCRFDPATRVLDPIPRLAAPRPWPELLGVAGRRRVGRLFRQSHHHPLDHSQGRTGWAAEIADVTRCWTWRAPRWPKWPGPQGCLAWASGP